ncbi:MAG: phosphoribosylformylglycinamidine synthase [Acidiferrobacterales bacterium]
MDIISLKGQPALSAFRAEQLLSLLQETEEDITDIYAEFWHFISVKKSLSKADLKILDRLLKYGPDRESKSTNSKMYLVIPRLGTISPWSTKATDIAHCCGLEDIIRMERGIAWYVETKSGKTLPEEKLLEFLEPIYDRMTEIVTDDPALPDKLFEEAKPAVLTTVNIKVEGKQALAVANKKMGLALSDDEIEYLLAAFSGIDRDPTDIELMMFAQANSEHCRHKIFNADWIINKQKQSETLFSMIRSSHAQTPGGTLVAYSDNAAVIAGATSGRFFSNPKTGEYSARDEPAHIVMKVETHNHPTAISPFPGAATGSGGEIRDEGATGRGAKPKAGITGFSVSNLRIPGATQDWETDYGKPSRIASALDIMLEGPIGGASFNNEFGRPNLGGYFRVFEQEVAGEVRGYHKPIMLAGGLGNIRPQHVKKEMYPAGTAIVVLGGPAMLIGLGGGAASSMTSGSSHEDLDFASVQRGNPEMERRCQEVIDRCCALGDENPILFIHDVGAGGLSNALPELIHDAGVGGKFNLRDVPNDHPGMTPLALWCNEAQERYVMAIDNAQLELFEALCKRERCPFAVVGTATDDNQLVVEDSYFAQHSNQKVAHDNKLDPELKKRQARPIDMDLDVLLGKPPKMTRDVKRIKRKLSKFKTRNIDFKEAAYRVLRHPSVASKNFLITIGDRSVTGLVCRDQMVGPWQVPVADVAVTCAGYQGVTGEAMSMGERSPLALINPAASGRMAIGEALTNITASRIEKLPDVKLSANWMAPAGHPGEDAALFDTVKAVATELCPQLGISIPVGKDSMSMKTVWQTEEGESRSVTAPVSLIVSAFAPVMDVRKTLTPQLRTDCGIADLILVDLGKGKHRMGGSILAQTQNEMGSESPDVDDPKILRLYFHVIQALNELGYLLAYHDRSDGGLFATLCEMAFAGKTGIVVDIDKLGRDPIATMFNEELGAVLQVPRNHREGIIGALKKAGLVRHTHVIGTLCDDDNITILDRGKLVFVDSRTNLHRAWSETTYQMQKMRDNPECAQEEYDSLLDTNNPGLSANLTFNPGENVSAPYIKTGVRPKMAILREEGVNGHVEMAAAFDRAGFTAVDLTMSDIIDGGKTLDDFKGLVACGGFSFGDVLGAGEGWAKSILFNKRARDVFEKYFHRDDTFALGVCNGCQMMSNLRELIPGTERWPHFVRNLSEQFEARLVRVQIPENSSILFQGMNGSMLPVVVSHGEGRAEFKHGDAAADLVLRREVVVCYVDNYGQLTQKYPANPNGSPLGITGVTANDGRFTIMMPHPERMFRTVTNSWHPDGWDEDSAWMRIFRNARLWLG